MTDQRAVELLAAHADALIGRSEGLQQADMTDHERDQMTHLFQLAARLQQRMQPVQPPAAFVRSLKAELINSARRQAVLTERKRRSVLIGAAAVGSVVSIASVVGAIVFLVPRLRARAQARVAPAPMS